MKFDRILKIERDRRKSKRFDLPIRVEYRTLTKEPLLGKAKTNDVSRFGISITGRNSTNLLDRGTVLELQLQLEKRMSPVMLRGRITWSRENKLGVRLVGVSREDQERILEKIYKHWLSQQRN